LKDCASSAEQWLDAPAHKPSVQEVASSSPPLNTTEIDRLECLANECYTHEKYGQAAQHYTKMLIAMNSALGANHPRLQASLHTIASLKWDSNFLIFYTVKVLYDKIIEIITNALGEGHPDRVYYLKIAGLYFASNSGLATATNRAIDLFQQALDNRRINHGEQHPDIAFFLHNIAICLHTQSKYAEAIKFCEQSLESLKIRSIQDDRLICVHLLIIGSCYTNLKRHSEALPIVIQSLVRLNLAKKMEENLVFHMLNTLKTCYTNLNRQQEGKEVGILINEWNNKTEKRIAMVQTFQSKLAGRNDGSCNIQ
jgi:tetratricopeptide (TPR) repeat protein